MAPEPWSGRPEAPGRLVVTPRLLVGTPAHMDQPLDPSSSANGASAEMRQRRCWLRYHIPSSALAANVSIIATSPSVVSSIATVTKWIASAPARATTPNGDPEESGGQAEGAGDCLKCPASMPYCFILRYRFCSRCGGAAPPRSCSPWWLGEPGGWRAARPPTRPPRRSP